MTDDASERPRPPKPVYKVEMTGIPTRYDPGRGTVSEVTGAPTALEGLRPHPMGKENPIRPLIGAELNEAAREELARPFQSAPLSNMNAGGPSIQSQREAQDKPFQTQRIERSIPMMSQERPDAAPNLLAPETRWDATLGNVRDEVPVQKSHPPITRGEAAIWTPRGRVVVDRGAPSPGEDRTDIVQPSEATPNPASQLAGEEGKSPKYEPGPHDPKSKTTYVYSWAEYANPRRLAPKREPSPASEATAEGDNVDVPVDDSGGSGGA